jgi:hypothetical protein
LAANLPALGIAYGTDKFYSTLEAAFPISDYSRADNVPRTEINKARPQSRAAEEVARPYLRP